jgi:hypothetical protein
MRETEIAWASGFFDGEGSIQVSGKFPNSRVIQIRVSQTDRRPLERFKEAVCCGNLTRDWGNVSRWQVSGKKAIDVLEMMWPYMSDPKKEQAIRIMERMEIEKELGHSIGRN